MFPLEVLTTCLPALNEQTKMPLNITLGFLVVACPGPPMLNIVI